MKKISKLLLLLLLIVVAAQSVFIFILYTERNEDKAYIEEFENSKFEKLTFVENTQKEYEGTEYEAMQAIEKKPINVSELEATGWIPDWDFEDGFNTLKNNKGFFTGVNPFWYEIKGDGTLTELRNVNNSELKNYSKDNGVELIPTITSFDTDVLSELLSSDENIERHVNAIVTEVKSKGYDGIDLDYESIYLKDKEKFFEMLQKLSIKMIEANKKLTFTAHPKWGNDVYYGGLPQSRMVLDYKRIADLVDELRIMTYEFTGRNNLYYGPNAPINWMEDVIRYAILDGVPREKIMIGIPTYSYDFTIREKMQELVYYPVFVAQTSREESAIAYYNEIIDEIKANNNFNEEFESEWGEMVLKYRFEGKDRVIVYPNSKSIELRKQLAADYGIKGVAFWRLGDEGSLKYQ